MSRLTLTVLSENTAREGLAAEHGLSVHALYEGHALLLDSGQSSVFAENAVKLGIDLSAVELAFLSHGHFDHSNGFPALFALAPAVPLLARPAVTAGDWHGERYIGLAPTLFKEYAHRFRLDDGPRQPLPGVWLIPDAVAHEQSLVFETEEGLVILNSCCHAGADEVVRSVTAHLPGKPVRALLGGFHLMGPGGPSTLGKQPGEVLALGRRLLHQLGVAQIWTGHCTGTPALALLQGEFPGQIHPLSAGLTLSF